MTTRGWPLLDLRVTTPRVELRLAREDELLALADRAVGRILEPAQAAFMGAWTQLPSPEFEQTFMRRQWRQRAEWTPESWRLALGAFAGGELVGGIDLWAKAFPALRSAVTGSWLLPEARGQGIGKAARAAVLQLAFEGLGAQVVRSFAHPDNAATLAISRALGYREDGTSTELAGEGESVEALRFKLTRDDWTPRGDIVLSGLRADQFGL